MYRTRLVVLLAAAFMLTACGRPHDYQLHEQKVENVVRIILRQEGVYTLFVQDPESNRLEEKYLRIKMENRQFIVDVPPSQKAWILLNKDAEGRVWNAVFHIHSPADLGAGGYTYQSGKSTRQGQTETIE